MLEACFACGTLHCPMCSVVSPKCTVILFTLNHCPAKLLGQRFYSALRVSQSEYALANALANGNQRTPATSRDRSLSFENPLEVSLSAHPRLASRIFRLMVRKYLRGSRGRGPSTELPPARREGSRVEGDRSKGQPKGKRVQNFRREIGTLAHAWE